METSSAPRSLSERLEDSHCWDWKAALITIAIVEISSTRLVITEWAPFLYFTQTMAFFGVILGLVLGHSKFSRQAIARLTTGYTLVLIPIQLLSAVEKQDWLWDHILALLERLFFALDQFITNKPVEDPLFFVTIVTLTYWFIALAAGYWLVRHSNYLNVVLPSGLAILTVQVFDTPQSRYAWALGLFIFASLLLLGRLYFLKNRSFWKRTHFLLTDESVNDLERGALVMAGILVLVAWSLPSVVSGVKPARQAWREFSQPIFDRFSNAISALESPYAEYTESGDFYASALTLGKQAATGESTIFTVKVQESRFTPVRSYWKGRNYGLYLNGRWTTVGDSSESFIPAIHELGIEYPQDREEMAYTFTLRARQQSLLYAPAETIWVSKSAKIQSMPITDEAKDVTAWIAQKSLSSGSQYRVRALIADPSIEELRAAGTRYPAWVTDRYLQVPEEIAPQLKELALEITESQETAYDKAQAITSYLREEIIYQKAIDETPPENLDPVLWVLFDYKKGFCMYYASAETLLLRSIGIPARMTVGFVEGAYDEMTREYNVAYKDSHAWPEVYFPGIGWVEFEPTSNQFPIERPEKKNTPEELAAGLEAEDGAVTPLPTVDLGERPRPLLDEETDAASTTDQPAWYSNLIIPALVLLMFGAGIFLIQYYSLSERLPVYLAYQYERRGSPPPQWLSRWMRWTQLSPIERAFQSVNLSLLWLGQPQPRYVTSQERADVLIKSLPAVEEQTRALLQEYHNAIYTPHKGNPVKARRAALKILLKTRLTLIRESLQSTDSSYNQLQ